MKYTILLYETEADFSARRDNPPNEAYWGAYRAYTKALQDAGVMVGGAGLQPAQVATTVRQHNGKRQVQDGPFAEAKEQLGGYYVLEVPVWTRRSSGPRCPPHRPAPVGYGPIWPCDGRRRDRAAVRGSCGRLAYRPFARATSPRRR